MLHPSKWTIAILLATVCTLPAAAQTAKQQRTTKPQTRIEHLGTALEQQLKTAAQRAQTQEDTCTCAKEPLTTQELIEAEEELSNIRNSDIHATFEKYPYLLNPLYRRHKNGSCPAAAPQQKAQSAPTAAAEEDEELSIRELIDAETELGFIRNTWDSRASFDKYPYLLDPEYRRTSDETIRARVRQEYKNGTRKYTPQPEPQVTTEPTHTTASWHTNPDSTRARKVGI